MDDVDIGALIGCVIELSEADDWEHARREWEVTSCYDDPDHAKTCVCGKEGLRYQYTITNVENGNTLFPIGSTCIKKFEVDEMSNEVKCWRQAFRLMDEAARLSKGRRVGIHSGYFSRKLLAFMQDQGVFKPTSFNGNWGYGDYLFLLDMFNAREMTPRQEKKADAVIGTQVYPWLRSLWIQRRREERS